MTGEINVIVHESSLSGAPKVLLQLLRFASESDGPRFAVRSIIPGPLDADFEAVSNAEPSELPRPTLVNGLGALTEFTGTASSAPLLVYFHEVGESFDLITERDMELLSRPTTRVLCVSHLARSQLEALPVPPSDIHVLPPAVRDISPPPPEAIAAARTHMGVGPGPLVVGCGEAVWRKGPDLFLEVASSIAASRDVEFRWIGKRTAANARVHEFDTDMLGLRESTRFIGEVDDAIPYLAAADVLLMTSRNDPQPLVMIEAGLAGTPTAGWNHEGLADLAAVDGAEVAPYPRIHDLAAATLSLLDSPERCDELVANARRRHAESQSIAVTGRKFVDHLAWLTNGTVVADGDTAT